MSVISNAWERFTATGAVEDYLHYLAESREEQQGGEAIACFNAGHCDPHEVIGG